MLNRLYFYLSIIKKARFEYILMKSKIGVFGVAEHEYDIGEVPGAQGELPPGVLAKIQGVFHPLF